MSTAIHVVWPEDKAWYAAYANGSLFLSGPAAPTREQSSNAATAAGDGNYEVTFVTVAAGTPFASIPQDEASIPEAIVLSRVASGF